MTGLRLELTGASAAIAALDAAAARLDRPGPMFDEIGRMLTISTQNRFETGIDPDGVAWPYSIRALTTGGKTMVDSTQLVGSITWEASDAGVAVGTNVIYAAVHQLGDTIFAKTDAGLRFRIGETWITKASVTLPQRAFLGIDDDDEAGIVAIAGDFILEPLGGADERVSADG